MRALPVGQPAVVEHLQQDVEHVRMSLLDLVEQHDGVRTTPHRLGELAAFVVADVTGRRPDQAGHRVLLRVLAHVDADHGSFVVEQERGQRLGQLGLADAGRAQEQERSGRTVGVADAGPGPAHGVGHGLHSRLLTDHAMAEFALHAQQLGRLALQQPPGRNPGPGRDHGGDVVGGDFLGHHDVGRDLGGRGLGQLAFTGRNLDVHQP